MLCKDNLLQNFLKELATNSQLKSLLVSYKQHPVRLTYLHYSFKRHLRPGSFASFASRFLLPDSDGLYGFGHVPFLLLLLSCGPVFVGLPRGWFLLRRLLGVSIQGPKGISSDPTCVSGFGRTSMAASFFFSATSFAAGESAPSVWFCFGQSSIRFLPTLKAYNSWWKSSSLTLWMSSLRINWGTSGFFQVYLHIHTCISTPRWIHCAFIDKIRFIKKVNRYLC